MELSIGQPFDLASSVLSGQAHRWLPDPSGEGWYWGIIQDNLIKIRQLASPTNGHSLDGVEAYSSPTVEPERMECLLSGYFRLDDDVEAIYCDITRDSRVADMVNKYRGLRLLRIEPWECLVSFICSANSNLARIQANMEAMSDAFGQPLTLDGYVRHTFPAPERLADAGEASLRALGLGFRAPYVAQTAVRVAGGDLHLESLRKMPYPEAKEQLMELPGVGPKIADCVLLHSLDKLEAFPIDVWVRRALSEWYFPSGDLEQGQKPPPDKAMLEWALEHFGPYAGYAELYLFHGRRLGKG